MAPPRNYILPRRRFGAVRDQNRQLPPPDPVHTPGSGVLSAPHNWSAFDSAFADPVTGAPNPVTRAASAIRAQPLFPGAEGHAAQPAQQPAQQPARPVVQVQDSNADLNRELRQKFTGNADSEAAPAPAGGSDTTAYGGNSMPSMIEKPDAPPRAAPSYPWKQTKIVPRGTQVERGPVDKDATPGTTSAFMPHDFRRDKATISAPIVTRGPNGPISTATGKPATPQELAAAAAQSRDMAANPSNHVKFDDSAYAPKPRAATDLSRDSVNSKGVQDALDYAAGIRHVQAPDPNVTIPTARDAADIGAKYGSTPEERARHGGPAVKTPPPIVSKPAAPAPAAPNLDPASQPPPSITSAAPAPAPVAAAPAPAPAPKVPPMLQAKRDRESAYESERQVAVRDQITNPGLRTKGVVDAIEKGNLGEAASHVARNAEPALRSLAGMAGDALNHGGASGSRLQKSLSEMGRTVLSEGPNIPPDQMKRYADARQGQQKSQIAPIDPGAYDAKAPKLTYYGPMPGATPPAPSLSDNTAPLGPVTPAPTPDTPGDTNNTVPASAAAAPQQQQQQAPPPPPKDEEQPA